MALNSDYYGDQASLKSTLSASVCAPMPSQSFLSNPLIICHIKKLCMSLHVLIFMRLGITECELAERNYRILLSLLPLRLRFSLSSFLL